FFHDLFGTAPDNGFSIFKTFGLLVALAVLSAARLLYLELKRRAEVGQFTAVPTKVTINAPLTPFDYLFNGLFGFFLGFKGGYIAQNLSEMQADPGSVLLSMKGNWLLGILGAAAFTGYYFWVDRQRKQAGTREEIQDIFPHHRVVDIATVAVISGIIGAKVFTIIDQPGAFFSDPLGQFFSGAGWTIYGGLIGGFLGCVLWLRWQKIPVVPALDAVAVGLIVSYGVGRMGCHFSGDGDWGIVAAAQPDWWFLPDWVWAYDYPRNVIQEGQPLPDCVGIYCKHLVPAVYPTPIYEITMAFAIGAILWSLRKRLTPLPGALFALYLVFNGVERFFIEKIRVNDEHSILGGMTQAEFIAVIFVVAGLAWLGLIWAKQRQVAR
ncbi:MAG: prolipoprotein diacylglyceryl transferase family protein, partial [Bacteroidota bacterium]